MKNKIEILDEIIPMIKTKINEVTDIPISEIDNQQSLMALNLDSMTTMLLISDIETQLMNYKNINLTYDIIFQHDTIEKLANYITHKILEN